MFYIHTIIVMSCQIYELVMYQMKFAVWQTVVNDKANTLPNMDTCLFKASEKAVSFVIN